MFAPLLGQGKMPLLYGCHLSPASKVFEPHTDGGFICSSIGNFIEFGIFDFVERSGDLLATIEYAKDGYAVRPNGKGNCRPAAKAHDTQVWPDIIAAGAAVRQSLEAVAIIHDRADEFRGYGGASGFRYVEVKRL